MVLVERHIIDEYHNFFKECDKLSFKSKNLYNTCLYSIRQHYFKNKKYLNYNDNYHLIKSLPEYNELPTKVSCQVIKKVDKNFKSFFGSLKSNLVKSPKLPKYLDKDGRSLIVFPKQSISLKEFKKTGKIKLSKTEINIKTKIRDFNNIKEVRIIPRNRRYIIEVVYNKTCKMGKRSGIIASVDGGLNNLSTITFNNGTNPFIINGKPLKSMNQFYNKKKSEIQMELAKINKKSSKRIVKLSNKRINKINDYLHKSSRLLVNQLVLNRVDTLIIGKNLNMKQDINIGKKNNQNFTNLPLFRFFEMVKYKSELEGIKVQFQEESYTSKCSFFDGESVKKHDNYLGKRIKRGLFKTSSGKLVNADVNGSYNIMKKAIPNLFIDGIEGLGVVPLKFNIL
jgi:putative transposase